jgi:hypothetical protein
MEFTLRPFTSEQKQSCKVSRLNFKPPKTKLSHQLTQVRERGMWDEVIERMKTASSGVVQGAVIYLLWRKRILGGRVRLRGESDRT